MDKKNVHVSFSSNSYDKALQYEVKTSVEEKYQAGLPIAAKITVTNNGSRIIKDHALTVASDALRPQKQVVHLIDIPPYGKKSADVWFSALPVLTNGTYKFTIQSQNDTIEQEVRVSPLVLNEKFIIGGVLIAFSITVLIITIKTGRIPFLRRKR
jgi:hypothetical protein